MVSSGPLYSSESRRQGACRSGSGGYMALRYLVLAAHGKNGEGKSRAGFIALNARQLAGSPR